MLKTAAFFFLVFSTFIAGSRADVVINEVVHAASERVLKWSAPHPAGIPRLGTGPAFYENAYDDRGNGVRR